MGSNIDTSPRSIPVRTRADLRILSIRRLIEDKSVDQILRSRGLQWANEPSQQLGSDPCVIWRKPTENWVLGTANELIEDIALTLCSGQQAFALAIDVSEAYVVLELKESALDAWLSRLVEPGSIHTTPHSICMGRVADVPAVLLRQSMDQLWLVVERSFENHLVAWLSHTHQAI